MAASGPARSCPAGSHCPGLLSEPGPSEVAFAELPVRPGRVQQRSESTELASPTRARTDGCERSIKIKLKIKKTYFENKSNTILKIKDLAAKIK